jgi:hypothetical protein
MKEEIQHIVGIKRQNEQREKEELRTKYLVKLNNFLSDVTKKTLHKIKIGDIQFVDNNIVVLFSIQSLYLKKTDITTFSKNCQINVQDYALKYLIQYIPSVKSIEITDLMGKINDEVSCYGQEFYIVISTN